MNYYILRQAPKMTVIPQELREYPIVSIDIVEKMNMAILRTFSTPRKNYGQYGYIVNFCSQQKLLKKNF